MSDVLVEGCVESLAGAIAAERAGARRIELCANLAEDGTTPDVATLAAVRARVALPVMVMIRPRPGSFVHDGAEVEAMERAIAMARTGGAAGFALGVLTPEDDVDRDALRTLLRAAGSLPVTFHRAFDRARDLPAALDALLDAGVRRVLTSGGAPTAREGLETIAALVRQAGQRLVVMPGGRVDAAAARLLVAEAGVRELHVGNEEARVRAVVQAVRGGRAVG